MYVGIPKESKGGFSGGKNVSLSKKKQNVVIGKKQGGRNPRQRQSATQNWGLFTTLGKLATHQGGKKSLFFNGGIDL